MISNWQSPLGRSLGEVFPLRGGTRQGFVSHPPIQISPQMSREDSPTNTTTSTHTHTLDPPPTLFVMKSNTWKRRSGLTTCASNCSVFTDTQERKERRSERGRMGREIKAAQEKKREESKAFWKRRNKQSSLKLRVSELLKLLPIFCPYSVLWTWYYEHL